MKDVKVAKVEKGSGREECMFCEQKTHAQCTSTRQHPLEENNTLKSNKAKSYMRFESCVMSTSLFSTATELRCTPLWYVEMYR
jgi:biotin synthase-like enzyme